MSAVTDARDQLAAAVTAAGLDCTAYPPEAPSAPASWIDSVAVDYAAGGGFSFCYGGAARATILSVGQRHDKAGASYTLEAAIPAVITALETIPGVRVETVDSGTAQVAGQDMPAVIYSVAFAVSERAGGE